MLGSDTCIMASTKKLGSLALDSNNIVDNDLTFVYPRCSKVWSISARKLNLLSNFSILSFKIKTETYCTKDNIYICADSH